MIQSIKLKTMKSGKFNILVLMLIIISGFSSCKKDDDGSPSTTTTKGRYIWWTSEQMNGYYSAKVVIGGLIYQDPYTHSNDGVTWTTDAGDNLWRSFERFSGYFMTEAQNETAGANISSIRTYTPLNGVGSITVDNSLSTTGISSLAWEGGNTVYAMANNSGNIYGGDMFDDYVLQSTDGGETWTPVTNQPPQTADHLALDNIWLIDGNLFVSEILYLSGGFTKYKLYMSLSGGLIDDWVASEELDLPLSLQGAQGIGGIEIYASDDNGTYQLEIKGPTFIFHDLEFEDDGNLPGEVVGLASVNGGNNQNVFINFYGLYIIDPVTKKYYNPSEEGVHSIPGVAGMVVFGDELVVTAGSNVYKTPYPFVFHEKPE